MKIKNYGCKCGSNEFFFSSKGNQTGIYCNECGKWLKWADKDEQNLTLKRTDNSVLDKIREEIEKAMHSAQEDSRITQDDVDCGVCAGIQRAIDIIDKYKDKGVEE